MADRIINRSDNFPAIAYGAQWADAIYSNGAKIPGIWKFPTDEEVIIEGGDSVRSIPLPVSGYSGLFTNNVPITLPIGGEDWTEREKFTTNVKLGITLNLANANAAAYTKLAPNIAWFEDRITNNDEEFNKLNVHSKISYLVTSLTNDSTADLDLMNLNSSNEGLFSGATQGFPVGNTPEFIYSLSETFIHKKMPLLLEKIRGGILNTLTPSSPVLLVYTPGPNGGTVITNSPTAVTVAAIRVIMDGYDIHRDCRAIELKDLSTREHGHNYLKAITKSQTIAVTPGQPFEISLDGNHGRVHFVDIKFYQPEWDTLIGYTGAYNTLVNGLVVPNQVANGTCGYLTGALYLGDTATYTTCFRDCSTESKLENLTGRYIFEQMVPKYFNNKVLQRWKGMIRLRMNENMEAAFNGCQRNITYMRRKNNSTVTVTAATAVYQVDLLTKSQGALAWTAGTSTLLLKIPELDVYEETDPFPYNATAGTINAAFNRLPWALATSTVLFTTISGVAYNPATYDPTVIPFTAVNIGVNFTYLSLRYNGIGGNHLQLKPNAIQASNNNYDLPYVTTTTFGSAGLPPGVLNLTVYTTVHVSQEARLFEGRYLDTHLQREIKRLPPAALILAAEAGSIDRAGLLKQMREEMAGLLSVAVAEEKAEEMIIKKERRRRRGL
jgi:hypothetical protein